MDAPQRYTKPPFQNRRPTRTRYSRAQIDEVLSFLDSESSVREARIHELEMGGVDPGLIRAALAELKHKPKKESK